MLTAFCVSSTKFGKNLVRLSVVALVVAFAAMTPAVAKAATITQKWDSSDDDVAVVAPNNISYPLDFVREFTKFDPSLGTLNSVVITVNGEIVSSFSFEQVDGLAGDYTATTDVDFVLKDDDLLGTTLLTLAINDSQSKTLASSDTFVGPPIIDNDSILITHNTVATVAPFIGAGEKFHYSVKGNDDSTSTGPGNLNGGYTTLGSYTVTIEYNYTTSTVPEPSSMALLGLGCCALGAYRRISRRRASQSV